MGKTTGRGFVPLLEAKTAIASSLKVPLMANPYLEGAAIVSPLSPYM